MPVISVLIESSSYKWYARFLEGMVDRKTKIEMNPGLLLVPTVIQIVERAPRNIELVLFLFETINVPLSACRKSVDTSLECSRATASF